MNAWPTDNFNVFISLKLLGTNVIEILIICGGRGVGGGVGNDCRSATMPSINWEDGDGKTNNDSYNFTTTYL